MFYDIPWNFLNYLILRQDFNKWEIFLCYEYIIIKVKY